jgi:hypothetical protein
MGNKLNPSISVALTSTLGDPPAAHGVVPSPRIPLPASPELESMLSLSERVSAAYTLLSTTK